MRNEAKLSFIKQASRSGNLRTLLSPLQTIINCGCVISYSVRITGLVSKIWKVVDICVIDTKIALYLQVYESTYNGHYDDM